MNSADAARRRRHHHNAITFALIVPMKRRFGTNPRPRLLSH
jgi:hypothetical protein